MPRIVISLILLCVMPLQLFPKDNVTMEMRSVDRLALGVICAKQDKNPKEYKNLSLEVCETIVNSDLCKEVEPKKRRNCFNDLMEIDDSTIKEDIFACLEGFLTSVHDIYLLVKGFMHFIKNYCEDEEYRSKTNQNAEAKVDNLLLNYEAEVSRVALGLNGPLKESRASLIVAKDLLVTQIGNLWSHIKNETAEFACLNEAAVTERSCKMLGTMIVPSFIFFKIILKGRSTLTAFVKSSINKGKNYKAIREERALKNKLMSKGPIKEAFDAHKEAVIKNYRKGLEINRHESSTLKYQEDKKKVSELYAKGEVKEAARLNYQLNINRLVEQFPDHVREKMNTLLSNDYQIIDSPNYDGGFRASMFKPNGYMQVELPAKFHGTELEYFFKTHESHHAVMYYLNGVESTKQLYFKVNLLNDVKHIIQENYLNEAGAMAREWQYVDHIPKERIQTILDEMKNDPKCPPDMLEFTLKNFTANKNASASVIQKHKNGRYSKEAVEKSAKDLEGMYKQAILMQNVATGIKAATLGLMTKQVYSYCSDLKKSGEKTHFYQDICQKFPLFLGYFD